MAPGVFISASQNNSRSTRCQQAAPQISQRSDRLGTLFHLHLQLWRAKVGTMPYTSSRAARLGLQLQGIRPSDPKNHISSPQLAEPCAAALYCQVHHRPALDGSRPHPEMMRRQHRRFNPGWRPLRRDWDSTGVLQCLAVLRSDCHMSDVRCKPTHVCTTDTKDDRGCLTMTTSQSTGSPSARRP